MVSYVRIGGESCTKKGRGRGHPLMVVGIVGVCLTGCEYFETKNRTVHPTAANDTHEVDAQVSEDTLPLGLSPKALAEWRATKAAVLGARVVLTLGRDDHEPEVFGIGRLRAKHRENVEDAAQAATPTVLKRLRIS